MNDNKDYSYEVERTLTKYGGEADKDITRTCGNCHFYNTERRRCLCFDESEDETSVGCYQHRTHAEQERLAELVKQRQDEINRLRLEEQRRNGTGDCAGCPFREMRDMLEKVVSLDVLAGYWDMRNNCSLRESIEKLLKKARGEE